MFHLFDIKRISWHQKQLAFAATKSEAQRLAEEESGQVMASCQCCSKDVHLLRQLSCQGRLAFGTAPSPSFSGLGGCIALPCDWDLQRDMERSSEVNFLKATFRRSPHRSDVRYEKVKTRRAVSHQWTHRQQHPQHVTRHRVTQAKHIARSNWKLQPT